MAAKKNGDFNSDKPGRSFDRVGGGRHALGTEVEPREHELQVFVAKLAHLLDEGLKAKSFSQLAIVAPPHVLGVLVSHLHEPVKKLLIKEVHKDIPERISEPERIELLCKYLDLWNHA
jgi:Protein required for attachment to host cells.